MTKKSRNPILLIKGFLTHLVTLFWWHLPIKRENRKRIKDAFFSRFGFMFHGTRIYKSWQELSLLSSAVTVDNGIDYPDHWPKLIEHQARIVSPLQQSNRVAEPIVSLAIIIHAFYADILEEMLDCIGEIKEDEHKIFISCPKEKEVEMADVIIRYAKNYEISTFENRGRDVLPFLRVSQEAINQGYRLILKLHTKKSDHRMTGSLWRKEIFNTLLPKKNREKLLAIFGQDADIGLIGPVGHVVPMSLYYGINAKAIGYLCRQLGVDTRLLDTLNFVAGSMFYIRSEALQPLLKLSMPDTIFEPEAGQRDGTMAHAYERAFAIGNFAGGFKLVDTGYRPEKPLPRVTIDHPFTW